MGEKTNDGGMRIEHNKSPPSQQVQPEFHVHWRHMTLCSNNTYYIPDTHLAPQHRFLNLQESLWKNIEEQNKPHHYRLSNNTDTPSQLALLILILTTSTAVQSALIPHLTHAKQCREFIGLAQCKVDQMRQHLIVPGFECFYQLEENFPRQVEPGSTQQPSIAPNNDFLDNYLFDENDSPGTFPKAGQMHQLPTTLMTLSVLKYP
jgi:hypothetical protein